MKTLLIVDLQNDFMEGGALPVSGARALIQRINLLQPYFDLIVASRDWHPGHHCCFAVNHPGKNPGDSIEVMGHVQVLWPTHCVENTFGAQFVAGLETAHWAKIISKGIDPNIDSYSAFFDNEKQRSTGLVEYFRVQGVTEVHIAGVATDYCVKFSVLDALELGFRVIVIPDATRGINREPEDVEKAFLAMEQAGARMRYSDEVIAQALRRA